MQVTPRLLPAAGDTNASRHAAQSVRKRMEMNTGDECTAAACKSTGHKKFIDKRPLLLGRHLCWDCHIRLPKGMS